MNQQVPSSADTTAIEMAKKNTAIQRFLSEQLSAATAKIIATTQHNKNQVEQQKSINSQAIATIANRFPEIKHKKEVPSRYEREDALIPREDKKIPDKERNRKNRRAIDVEEND